MPALREHSNGHENHEEREDTLQLGVQYCEPSTEFEVWHGGGGD